MAKLKNRDKRKKIAARQRNQERQQKIDAGDFVKQFSGYTQISLKEETDDATIKAGVIKVGDWLENGYQIFKHERYFLIDVLMTKFDPTFTPAEMAWVTKDKLYRTDIVEVARQMAEEMTAGHKPETIDFDNSYIRIFA